jgi:predicted RNase H-like nuclease (RuvC/YqgF family)
LKRRIKNLKQKLTIVDAEINETNNDLDNKWAGRKDDIDKLQRKLRNYILNIEFRKNKLAADEDPQP